MIPNEEDPPKTLKEKINEPILNAKQIFAIMVTVLYEVISNVVIYALMEDPNWFFIILNVGIGIVIIVAMGLLRAAYPEEVPDRTIWAAFWLIWKQVVDIITDPKADPETKMNVLEKSIVWDVREWDLAYQEKLNEQIQYYVERKDAQVQVKKDELQEIEEKLNL